MLVTQSLFLHHLGVYSITCISKLQGELRAFSSKITFPIEPGTPPKRAPVLRHEEDITFDEKIAEAEEKPISQEAKGPQVNAPIIVQEYAQNEGRKEAGKPAVVSRKKAAPPPAPDRKKGALPPSARELLKKRAAGGLQKQPKVRQRFLFNYMSRCFDEHMS